MAIAFGFIPFSTTSFFSFLLFLFCQIDLFFSGEIYPWNKTLTRKGEISWGLLVPSADVSAGAVRRTTVVCAKDSKWKR